MDDNNKEIIPEPFEFIVNTSLYTYYKIEGDNIERLKTMEDFRGTVDVYCPKCKKDSVFRHEHEDFGSIQGIGFCDNSHLMESRQTIDKDAEDAKEIKRLTSDRVFGKIFACTRDENHLIYFVFKVYDKKICKIGQFPSLSDTKESELKKYRGVLDETDYKELVRAVGLNAHDVGIGAFVYLRRIFERIIFSTYSESSIGIEENEFINKGMEDKILALKKYLPAFLVENRNIYSILSKGVHDLNENECRKYFTPIERGIEIILDEVIAKKEFERKKAEASKSIQTIKNEIVSKNNKKG